MDAPRPTPDDDDSDMAHRHAALVERTCLRRDGDDTAPVGDILANEVAIALVYNGVSHAVMMASPLDLEDFATGFSLAESIVGTISEVRDITRTDHARGISLDIDIPAARFARLKERRRALTGRTGCGLCGIDSLDEALRPPPKVAGGPRIAAAAIARAMAGLSAGQVLNRESHAVHAAAWAGPEGDILLLREDIGRHNAVDKLTGALARRGIDPSGGFLTVTSRCSFEIVHKAATAGIAVIAAVSAPTDYAVRLAEEAGITLIAFARGHRHSIYTRPERLIP